MGGWCSERIVGENEFCKRQTEKKEEDVMDLQ